MKLFSCKIICIFGLWVFNCSCLTAQVKVDSLKQALRSTENDSIRMTLLLDLGKELVYGQPDSAILIAEEVSALAKDLNVPVNHLEALGLIGECYAFKGDYQNGQLYFEKRLKLAQNLKDTIQIAKAKGGMAVIERFKGNYEKVLSLYFEVLKVYQKYKLKYNEARQLYSIAQVQGILGNDEKAYETLLLSEQVFRQLRSKDESFLGGVIIEKGSYFVNKGDLTNALKYYLEARKILEKHGKFQDAAVALMNIGQIVDAQENQKSARVYMKEAIALLEDNNIFIHRAVAYALIGKMYEDDTDTTIFYLRKSALAGEESGEVTYVAQSASGLALAYLEKQKYDSAQYYYEKALLHVKEIEHVVIQAYIWEKMGHYNYLEGNLDLGEEQMLRAYNIVKDDSYSSMLKKSYHLSKIYELKKDYKRSLEYIHIYNEVNDSLNSAEQVRQVALQEASFEHEKEILLKQNEIQNLEAKESIANIRLALVFIVVAVVLLVIGIIVWLIISRKNRKALQLKEINQFKEAMTGMIAHDLKNPLSIIMGSQSENQGTRRMAGRMLHLVQNMLDVHKFESTEVQLQKQPVSLDELIYDSIEQVRPLLSEKNVQISKSVEEHINVSADPEHLIRVFINFFTNAIKYSPNNSTIEVKGKVKDDRVDLSILDHGDGIAKEDQKGIFDAFKQIDARHSGHAASTGLGLAFCQLVLRAHGSEIEVDSEVEQWTEFRFSLQLSDAQVESSIPNGNSGVLTLTEDERKKILAAIPKLKSYGLHQAGEIELALKEFKTSSDQNTSRWVDEVLKAAYSNNESRYEELLEHVYFN